MRFSDPGHLQALLTGWWPVPAFALALLLLLGPVSTASGQASEAEAGATPAAEEAGTEVRGAEVGGDEADAGSDAAAPSDDEYDPLFDEFDEELAAEPAGFPDPLEGTNRNVFKFNGLMDRWLLDPLTRAYGFVFPEVVKQAIRNVFQNLGEPATTVNDILQLEWKDAGVSLSRFVINSSVGVAGIWDPAALIGLDYHRSDFGQTLALAGTPSGAYLILPVMGPNNTRDGFGVLADFTMHPLTWFLGPTNFLLYGIYGGGHGISTREEALPKLEALREGSVDYYAAMRNAYYQNRQAQIWGRREDRRDDWKVDGAAGPAGEAEPD